MVEPFLIKRQYTSLILGVLLIVIFSFIISSLTPQGNTFEFEPMVDDCNFLDPDKIHLGDPFGLAMKRNYTIRVEVSDLNGATDINYVDFTIDPSDMNLKFRWTEATDTFTETNDPNGYIQLFSDANDSNMTGSAVSLDFEFVFAWNYSSSVAENVAVYVRDDGGKDDLEYFGDECGVETDLDGYQKSSDDSRCNPNQANLNFTGYLVYDGTTITAPDGNYNVKVELDSVQKGSTDETLVDGFFEVSDVTAEATLDSYYYNIEATHLNAEENFPVLIVDRIEVEVIADDENPAINQNVTFIVNATYWFDGTPVSGLTFQVDRNTTSGSATESPFYDLQSTLCIYNYTCTSANETGYDLNTFTTNVEWVEWGVEYNLYGVYDEDTGLLLPVSERTVTVTVYFTGNTTDTFLLNGTANREYGTKPVYFSFDLNKTREYWLSPDEYSFNLYVFEADTEFYHIEFLDLADALETYEYVSAHRLVNGTLHPVEKRRIDEEDKVAMALKYMETYTIYLTDAGTYVFGNVHFGLDPTVQLTIKGVYFPKEVAMIQKYIRIYADRSFGANGTGNITLNYQDLLYETYSATVSIQYLNGTEITSYLTTADVFSYTWVSASNFTAYWCQVTYNHQTFGTQVWKQYMPRTFNTNPLDIGFLGSFSIDTAVVIPMVIILLCASLFSVISVPIGMFVTLSLAILFTIFGWIPLTGSVLVVGFAIVIMAGIGLAKRRMGYQ